MSDSSRLKIVLPVVVLLVGGALAAVLIASRDQAQTVDRPALGPLVETLEVEHSSPTADLAAHGEVAPATEVSLAPQVGGRVVAVAEQLVAGGRFRAGETLVWIEPRDYELAVERARAAVARATTQLEREEAEAAAARAEWEELDRDESPSSLLVRGPQVAQARAELDAARADLATARLALERTRLSVPFDGMVVEETADVGELLAPGQIVGRVYATDRVEIRLPVDDRDLAWVDVPEVGAAGPAAEVVARLFGAEHRWMGQAERLEGRLDPRSRLAHLVVTVEGPFESTRGRPPLLPGTFVEVTVEGRRVDDVAVVPRSSVREGDTVWVAQGETLVVRAVEVLRRDRQSAWVRDGLEPGDRLIVSALDAVTDGMTIRAVRLDDPAAAAPSGDAS